MAHHLLTRIYINFCLKFKTLNDFKLNLLNTCLIIPTARIEFLKNLKISFPLYPSHSRVGKGNLSLRHSVPHFLPNSGGIACRVAELNAALVLDTKAKKWIYKFKELFHLFEWRSNPQPVGFTVTLCAPAPRLASRRRLSVRMYIFVCFLLLMFLFYI